MARPLDSLPRVMRLGDTDQIVGGQGHGERHADPFQPAEPSLATAADRLQPTEDFLDPLVRLLAERVAGMKGGALSIAERRVARSAAWAFWATRSVNPTQGALIPSQSEQPVS